MLKKILAVFLMIFYFMDYINTQAANIIQSKNVCMCPFEGGFTTIGCSRNARIQITNAYTYVNDDIKNCSDETLTSRRFFVRDIMEARCNNNRNCSLDYGIFFGPSEITIENISNCKNGKFEWICVSFSEQSVTSTPDYSYSSWSMGFTYFFYIITLVLSTTCIVVGAVFLLRRFIIMRRRTRAGSGGYRGRTDHGSLYRFFIRYQNGQNNGPVAEDVRPPPSYDNIYSVSTAVNPLPSYSAALTLKSLENPENINNNKTTTDTQIAQINETPIVPTTTNNLDINNTSDVINSNNSSILNGEINLGFTNEIETTTSQK